MSFSSQVKNVYSQSPKRAQISGKTLAEPTAKIYVFPNMEMFAILSIYPSQFIGLYREAT